MTLARSRALCVDDSMAAGVQGACAVVCFMSSKYESSANCALELKFAVQNGVPLVPVLIEDGFRAGGWLGLVTAVSGVPSFQVHT